MSGSGRVTSRRMLSNAQFVPAVATDTDPTADAVSFAFTAEEEDDPVTWTAGEWSVVGRAEPVFIDGKFKNGYKARIVVSGIGNGGDVELAEGDWWVWVRFTSINQQPVRQVGKLTVT